MAERHCIFMDVAGYGKWQRKCREIAAYMEEFEERMRGYAPEPAIIRLIPYKAEMEVLEKADAGGHRADGNRGICAVDTGVS